MVIVLSVIPARMARSYSSATWDTLEREIIALRLIILPSARLPSARNQCVDLVWERDNTILIGFSPSQRRPYGRRASMHSMHTLRLIRISIEWHGERHTPFDRIGGITFERARPSIATP